MEASDYVPNFFKNRLHLAGRPQMSTHPEAHARFKSNADGQNSQVYSALARVPSDLFGLLSAITLGGIAASPKLTPELQAEVDLDGIYFISSDHLQTVLAGTSATPAQVAEAVRVNTEARLRALKIGLLVMAGLAFLTIIPASRLLDYRPGELPAEQPETSTRPSPGVR